MSYSGYDRVVYFPNGTIKSMVAQIDTEWKVGTSSVYNEPGKEVLFYPNGQVKKINVAENSELRLGYDRIILLTGSELEFYENGKIKSFVIGRQRSGLVFKKETWEYRGVVYKPGTRIEF